MATQSRDDLKTYFETNDVPTQIEFGHLIDSSLNLADTGTQLIQGTISASSIESANGFLIGNVQLTPITDIDLTTNTSFGNSVDDIHRFTGSIQQTGSNSYFLNYLSVGTTVSALSANLTVEGDISASGTIYASKYHNISSSTITSSGNIWAKGYVSASAFNMSDANLLVKSLTVNGIISGSGTISGSNLHIANNATVKGNITSPKTGSFGYVKSSTDVSASGHIHAQTYKGRLGKQLIHHEVGGTSSPLNTPRIEIGTSADSLPVRIFGNITASGLISSSGQLYVSASSAEGSHDNVLLYDTSTGRIYHTGSYNAGGSGVSTSDLDWEIKPKYVTSSKAIQITSSLANTVALNVRQNSSGDIARFKRGLLTKFLINNQGKVDIGHNVGDGDFNMQDNTSTVEIANDPMVNIQGPMRIKANDCRLYLEDTSGDTVWRLQNQQGNFHISNTNKNSATGDNDFGYKAMEIGKHTIDGGRIVFNTIDADSKAQETLVIRSSGGQPCVGINKTSPTHTLDINGDLHLTGTIFGTSFSASDIRKKENIRNLESQLSNISKIQPRRFDWKKPQKHQFNDIGFIAQEIQEVLPEVVVEGDIGPKNEDKYLHVAYSKLTPVLVKAIQEHQSILDDLEQRLNDLENK
jgi:hypothetical protein